MKRTVVTCALACLMVGAGECAAAEYLAGANLFGAFTTESPDASTGCAALDVTGLAAGTPVQVVVLAKPQRLLTGAIASKSTSGCSRFFRDSQASVFYEVAITHGRFQPDELGVLVLPGVALAQGPSGNVTARLLGAQYRFSECSSTEGVHLLVRSSGRKARAIWHDYIYLGIDVEPTCRKADYRDIDGLRAAVNRGARAR